MNRDNAIESNVESIWTEITDVDTITDIVNLSKYKTQIIYKHSHLCGVCLIAKEEVES